MADIDLDGKGSASRAHGSLWTARPSIRSQDSGREALCALDDQLWLCCGPQGSSGEEHLAAVPLRGRWHSWRRACHPYHRHHSQWFDDKSWRRLREFAFTTHGTLRKSLAGVRVPVNVWPISWSCVADITLQIYAMSYRHGESG